MGVASILNEPTSFPPLGEWPQCRRISPLARARGTAIEVVVVAVVLVVESILSK